MTLENISAGHLRQVLEQVEESAASERLTAAITYKEFDDVTQAEAAELYGYSEGWASKWFNRLERLIRSCVIVYRRGGTICGFQGVILPE